MFSEEGIFKGTLYLLQFLKTTNRPELAVYFHEERRSLRGFVVENTGGVTAYNIEIEKGFNKIKDACYKESQRYGDKNIAPETSSIPLLKSGQRRYYRFSIDISPVDVSLTYKNASGKRFSQDFNEIQFRPNSFLPSESDELLESVRNTAHNLESILATVCGRHPQMASLLKRIATDEFMTLLYRSDVIPDDEVERVLNLLMTIGLISGYGRNGKDKTISLSF